MRLQHYILNELFDTKVPITFKGKEITTNSVVYFYIFDVDDDLTYEFNGYFYPISKEGNFYPPSVEYDNMLNIEFNLMNAKGGGFGFAVQGTGNTGKVFSGVKLCLIDLMKRVKKDKHNVEYIVFDCDKDEPSREKLYDRFTKLLPRIIKGFKFHKKEYNQYIYKKKK